MLLAEAQLCNEFAWVIPNCLVLLLQQEKEKEQNQKIRVIGVHARGDCEASHSPNYLWCSTQKMLNIFDHRAKVLPTLVTRKPEGPQKCVLCIPSDQHCI